MILGTGIDLAPVQRLSAFLRRRGEAGLRRLFTDGEIRYCSRLARPDPSLAARFAAKEAFFKAVGTGYGRGGRWTDVEVLRGLDGRPTLALHARARDLARALGVTRTHVSLSHTADLATAIVVLER